MSQGPFSPVMLIANDGLLQNQGLSISGNLTIAINAYESTVPVDDYLSILSSAAANVGVGNDQISSSTFSSLQTLAANTFPAITDAVPTAYASSLPIGNSSAGFSGLVTAQAQKVLGNGDLSQFAQVYGICQSYIIQNNPYINSVKNSSILDSTFTSMNNLTTGSISDLNKVLPIFGADLVKLGQAWDLSNLQFFGYPWALLYQLSKSGGILPELQTQLINSGVSSTDLSNIQNGQEISSEVDLLIYQVMSRVTGALLDQVKTLLRVTTPNLQTMADLLNPIKTLPDSYLQLTTSIPTNVNTAPITTQLVNVYLPNSAVNSNILPTYAADDAYINLAKVIPPDQALANRAIANSLQQIKNIFALALPQLASAVLTVETNAGLTDINSLTQPVPTGVATSLNSLLATGTGPNGTLTLFDFMGAAAGIPYTAEFNNCAVILNYMQTANALYYLTDSSIGVYPVLLDTLNGVYTVVVNPGPPAEITITIPGGLPGAGIYTSLDDAVGNVLIPAAGNIIANVIANNASNVTSLNNSFNTMAAQLSAEVNNLILAQVNFGDLTANARSSIMSLGSNLHEIGKDIAPQGQAEFFTAIANTQNIYGQAIIASFREGRNIAALDNVGIGTDTQIPASTI
jgi:hypothetical protein